MKQKIAIVMGSNSDWNIMKEAYVFLKESNIDAICEVVSAHRTPHLLSQKAKEYEDKGIKLIIAGAGGAAHLPGMLASFSVIPVIGVPIKSEMSIEGVDSLLSIVQMPKGVPVATVGINNAYNAGVLALSILGSFCDLHRNTVHNLKKNQIAKVESMKLSLE